MNGMGVSRLFLFFLSLSLLSVGGVNTVLPEMRRQMVDPGTLLTHADFSELFAIAQASPGPAVLFVTLLGWKVAGISGAFLSTAGFILPSSVLIYNGARLWNRCKDYSWVGTLERGLAPVTCGLALGSAWLIARAPGADWRSHALTGAVALIYLFTRARPIWFLGVGGILGVLRILG